MHGEQLRDSSSKLGESIHACEDRLRPTGGSPWKNARESAIVQNQKMSDQLTGICFTGGRPHRALRG